MAGPFDFLRNNNQGLMQLGLGLLSGRTGQEQAAMGAQGLAGALNQNKTVQWLQKTNPDLAAAVQQGAISPGDAWKMAYTQKLEAQKPRNNFMSAGGSIFNTETNEWLTPPRSQDSDPETFYGNPIPIQTPNGIQYGQIGSRGSFKPINIGQGNTFAPAVKPVDTGTGTTFVGPGGVQVGDSIQKDLAGAEREKALGKDQAGAITGLPAAIQSADYGIKLIDDMLTHPGRGTATGASSTWDPRNYLSGTDATNFQVRARQIEGQAFLEAFESLKGAGQITEVEGAKATQAKARLDRAQSDEEYVAALNELKGILEIGKQRAIQRAQGGSAGGNSQGAAPAGRLRYNPQTGELE